MHVLSRRGFLLIAALATLLLAPATAEGGIGWCSKDPIVEIGGKRVHVYVASLDEILTTVTGPTDVLITVPTGVRTELISTDEGFNGLGYDVRFAESDDLDVTNTGIKVRVSVRVPASVELPVRVKVTDRRDDLLNREFGTTNSWVTGGVWL